MTHTDFDRRRFITVSTTAAASLLMGCPETGTVKPVQAADIDATGVAKPETANGSNQRAEAPAAQTPCTPTSGDITGPFWRKGIPIRNSFDVHGHPGTKLALSGTVQNGSCQPIPYAVIEMWHATPTTKAADALKPADSVDYDTEGADFKYYGQFATDERGEYSMSTKKPGWYLNGPAFRPSHIHVKIYVNGVERLTTQLYFEGDPFIANDPWASRAPKRAVSLRPTSTSGLIGRFDFTLS